MSLRAKLEAVIYAAEEPVTLAQLAQLFAADALEWKAEQEAAAAAATTAAEATTEKVDLDAELDAEREAELAFGEDVAPMTSEGEPVEAAAQEPAEAVAEEAAEPKPEDASAETEPSAEAGEPAATVEGKAEGEVASDAAADAAANEAAEEAEQKRQARLREKEVRAILRQHLDELVAYYAADDRGVEIREVAGGFRMATKPEYHDAVRAFVKSLKPPMKLSMPALETLAVIAYKQPVTAPEVNEIRGVDSSGVFGSLLARKLIATAGRKPVIGRPILYKTTREFLLRFGLKDVTELPSMEEFEKMAALELEEPEMASEEAPETGTHEAEETAAETHEEMQEPASETTQSAVSETADSDAGSATPTSNP
jgi:segregation and condensation protein B